ncbi:hypothetical protein HDU93_004396 [Gonapodya sp. JEL0774]|nr:hypothetical protein HDU93_004396 [Gonapodya sp. JEL0774]
MSSSFTLNEDESSMPLEGPPDSAVLPDPLDGTSIYIEMDAGTDDDLVQVPDASHDDIGDGGLQYEGGDTSSDDETEVILAEAVSEFVCTEPVCATLTGLRKIFGTAQKLKDHKKQRHGTTTFEIPNLESGGASTLFRIFPDQTGMYNCPYRERGCKKQFTYTTTVCRHAQGCPHSQKASTSADPLMDYTVGDADDLSGFHVPVTAKDLSLYEGFGDLNLLDAGLVIDKELGAVLCLRCRCYQTLHVTESGDKPGPLNTEVAQHLLSSIKHKGYGRVKVAEVVAAIHTLTQKCGILLHTAPWPAKLQQEQGLQATSGRISEALVLRSSLPRERRAVPLSPLPHIMIHLGYECRLCSIFTTISKKRMEQHHSANSNISCINLGLKVEGTVPYRSNVWLQNVRSRVKDRVYVPVQIPGRVVPDLDMDLKETPEIPESAAPGITLEELGDHFRSVKGRRVLEDILQGFGDQATRHTGTMSLSDIDPKQQDYYVRELHLVHFLEAQELSGGDSKEAKTLRMSQLHGLVQLVNTGPSTMEAFVEFMTSCLVGGSGEGDGPVHLKSDQQERVERAWADVQILHSGGSPFYRHFYLPSNTDMRSASVNNPRLLDLFKGREDWHTHLKPIGMNSLAKYSRHGTGYLTLLVVLHALQGAPVRFSQSLWADQAGESTVKLRDAVGRLRGLLPKERPINTSESFDKELWIVFQTILWETASSKLVQLDNLCDNLHPFVLFTLLSFMKSSDGVSKLDPSPVVQFQAAKHVSSRLAQSSHMLRLGAFNRLRDAVRIAVGVRSMGTSNDLSEQDQKVLERGTGIILGCVSEVQGDALDTPYTIVRHYLRVVSQDAAMSEKGSFHVVKFETHEGDHGVHLYCGDRSDIRITLSEVRECVKRLVHRLDRTLRNDILKRHRVPDILGPASWDKYRDNLGSSSSTGRFIDQFSQMSDDRLHKDYLKHLYTLGYVSRFEVGSDGKLSSTIDRDKISSLFDIVGGWDELCIVLVYLTSGQSFRGTEFAGLTIHNLRWHEEAKAFALEFVYSKTGARRIWRYMHPLVAYFLLVRVFVVRPVLAQLELLVFQHFAHDPLPGRETSEAVTKMSESRLLHILTCTDGSVMKDVATVVAKVMVSVGPIPFTVRQWRQILQTLLNSVFQDTTYGPMASFVRNALKWAGAEGGLAPDVEDDWSMAHASSTGHSLATHNLDYGRSARGLTVGNIGSLNHDKDNGHFLVSL